MLLNALDNILRNRLIAATIGAASAIDYTRIKEIPWK
jgi:hypothetical protein